MYSDHKEKNENYKLTAIESGVSGAISGFLTRAILQPLDVLKIRFQLQVEPTRKRKGGLYQGLFQATKTIVKQEGIASLWKGHIAAQVLTVFYGVGQFGSYTYFLNQAKDLGFEKNGLLLTASGGMAGMVGTLMSMPFDVARTRIVAQSIPKYTGLVDVFRKMYTTENFFSLWKGLTPSLLMTVPFTAIQFRIYYYLSNLSPFDFVKETKFYGFEISKPAVYGATAGVCAKLAVYPLDVLKKRIQIRGSEECRQDFGKVMKYDNIFDCIWKVTFYEGPLAWFKGLKPSLIKSATFSALVFTFYEISCDTILSFKGKR